MQKKTPRLQFTEDDLENPAVAKAAAKAEKAADKADSAKEPLPVKKPKLRHDETKGSQREAQLRFGKKDIREDTKATAKKKAKHRMERTTRAADKGGQNQSASAGPSAKRPVLTETDNSVQYSRITPEETAANRAGTASSTGRSAPTSRQKLKTEPNSAAKRKVHLRFEDSEQIASPGRVKRTITHAACGTVLGTVHRQISSNNEDNNTGIQAAHRSEEAVEGAARTVSHAQYSKRLKSYDKAAKLDRKADQANIEALYQKRMAENPETVSNPISRWRQKQEIKKEYAAMKAGRGTAGAAGSGVKTAETTGEKAENVLKTVKEFFDGKKNAFKIVLALGMVLVLLVTQLQSCNTLFTGALTTITATSWPADDAEITKADAYYTKLEAQLQRKINRMESSQPNCDEYNYSLAEIGHDPVMLISFLSAKYGAFTFNQVKSELDAVFALQYDLDVKTADETRTITKTVRAGEYIGEVVTSGYCSCSICCGIWAGGPTASGVYPTANHTIAVDARNPTVPMGTEIIMNGTLYKVEDTGNFAQYGVDFDVYYDNHSEALAHGHKTWQAYYAGGSGEEIEVTTTETVKVCYVTLTANDFESILTSRLTDEQKEMYDIYMQTKGNRVFFGTPLDCDWHLNIVGDYGWQCSGTSVQESEWLDVSVPEGMDVLSVLDGTVKSVSGDTITLENGKSYQVKLSGCSNIKVSAGQEVETGQKIAAVSSSGCLKIAFTYRGVSFNPYFYLDVGEGSVYGDTGDATGKAAMLIAKAKQYLGVPYVWGGYSPSGFDCSGFVSYAVNNCGAGFNFGRLTAEGWRQKCTTISASQARPGDLIFFQGTYNTSGASHIGIYLGNGQMIHAGSPVQISSINTSYWQQHFLCFGRIPGM